MKYKILGIQVRRTDHHLEVKPVRLTKYLHVIKKEIKKFDKIFIATDDERFLKLAVDSFGKEKILFNKVTRSDNGEPVHTNRNNINKYGLGLEVLIDCYCLSYCNKAILAHSNISYAALLIHPALKYRILETWHGRIKRFQTLLLYQLDRLGIRPL